MKKTKLSIKKARIKMAHVKIKSKVRAGGGGCSGC
jgi:hypothetical protein